MANKTTTIEEGTTFKGTLEASVPVLVHGRIEGELKAPGVTVAPGGGILGKVRVSELRTEGTIGGEFEAVVAVLGGTVKDGTILRARTLEVPAGEDGQGSVLFGNVELLVGEET